VQPHVTPKGAAAKDPLSPLSPTGSTGGTRSYEAPVSPAAGGGVNQQLSALLARQAAFEARVDTSIARLEKNLVMVADAVGARRSSSPPPHAAIPGSGRGTPAAAESFTLGDASRSRGRHTPGGGGPSRSTPGASHGAAGGSFAAGRAGGHRGASSGSAVSAAEEAAARHRRPPELALATPLPSVPGSPTTSPEQPLGSDPLDTGESAALVAQPQHSRAGPSGTRQGNDSGARAPHHGGSGSAAATPMAPPMSSPISPQISPPMAPEAQEGDAKLSPHSPGDDDHSPLAMPTPGTLGSVPGTGGTPLPSTPE